MGQLERIEEKLDQILKLLANEHERTPFMPPEPQPPRPATDFPLVREYKARYEAKRPNVIWEKWGMYREAFDDIRRQAHAQRCPDAEAMTRALDNFFADPTQGGKIDWSPNSLAKQFTKYFAPPDPEPAQLSREEKAEIRAAQKQEAEKRHMDRLSEKLADNMARACKPPPGLLEVVTGGKK